MTKGENFDRDEDFHTIGIIYTHPERRASFAHRLGVPLLTERITETSFAGEASGSGGILGFIQGSTKVGRGSKTSSKEILPEERINHEICVKALTTIPPSLFYIEEESDWSAISSGLTILVRGEGKLAGLARSSSSQPIPDIWEFHVRCHRRTVVLRGHESRVRRGTLWNHLHVGDPIKLSCVGIVTDPLSAKDKICITPIFIGWCLSDCS